MVQPGGAGRVREIRLASCVIAEIECEQAGQLANDIDDCPLV
jgi:hypothetical protein